MAPKSETWSPVFHELLVWWLSDLTVGDLDSPAVLSVMAMRDDESIWDETTARMNQLLSTWIVHHHPDLTPVQQSLFVSMGVSGWHQSLEALVEAVRVL